MALRRGKKREVVARVVDGGADNDGCKPKPGHCEVRTSDDRTSYDGAKVYNVVLQGMTVDRSHAHWSCPFMVFFVNMFVQLWMVKEPGQIDNKLPFL